MCIRDSLYHERLNEKTLLNGKALEDATNALLDQYLQTGEVK